MNKLLTVYDDTEPLNNVVNALSMDVNEVFYLYHHEEHRTAFTNIRKVIRGYKNIALHFIRPVDDAKEIDQILKDNDDVIVDVGGSKYLSLLLFDYANRNGNRIIYFDHEENVIKDYRTHTIIEQEIFKLTIKDVLMLRGGEITEYMHKGATDTRTKETIYQLFNDNLNNYSALMNYLSYLNKVLCGAKKVGNRAFRITKEQISEIKKDRCYAKIGDLFTIEGDRIVFKTARLVDVVTVSGTLLENYLYLKLLDAGQFDDVRMSVVVDFSDDRYDHPVKCEIDLLAIYNNRLMFVSCKSNKVETPALNEIYVHNSMFGNALSVPVICVCEDIDRHSPSMYAKAEELGIYMIDKSNMTELDFPEVFHRIITGAYKYDSL
ncbi:MAG: DUF1887 family protein [Erysipelotrichaceae bacterium]|nr:DUF1887 family protein [Erysipelotrichaceae bacterium]